MSGIGDGGFQALGLDGRLSRTLMVRRVTACDTERLGLIAGSPWAIRRLLFSENLVRAILPSRHRVSFVYKCVVTRLSVGDRVRSVEVGLRCHGDAPLRVFSYNR